MSMSGEPTIFQKIEAECNEAVKMISQLTTALNDATQKLNEASQKVSEQASLIEHLSKDNLMLVAKLDALTGKAAPGTVFQA